MPDGGIFTIGVPVALAKAGVPVTIATKAGGIKAGLSAIGKGIGGLIKTKGSAALANPVQTAGHAAAKGAVKGTVKQVTAAGLKKVSAKQSAQVLQHAATNAANTASQQSALGALETVGEAGLGVWGVAEAMDRMDKAESGASRRKAIADGAAAQREQRRKAIEVRAQTVAGERAKRTRTQTQAGSSIRDPQFEDWKRQTEIEHAAWARNERERQMRLHLEFVRSQRERNTPRREPYDASSLSTGGYDGYRGYEAARSYATSTRQRVVSVDTGRRWMGGDGQVYSEIEHYVV